MDKKQSVRPRRPILGGTKNGTRPVRYTYWRTGYASNLPEEIEFWVAQAGEYHTEKQFFTDENEYPSWHQFYYHAAGSAQLTVKNNRISLSPGDLILIPRGSPFSYTAVNSIQFHWFAIAGTCPLLKAFETAVYYALPLHQHIESIFKLLRETLILEQSGNAFRAISLIYDLFATLEAIQTDKKFATVYPETVRIALTFLKDNFQKPYSAERLAKHCGMSIPHLRTLFQKWVGESPNHYHQRYRIERAERHLLYQDVTVGEVAKQVGYTDPYYFSRVFKKITGIRPSHYRSTVINKRPA